MNQENYDKMGVYNLCRVFKTFALHAIKGMQWHMIKANT